MVRYIKNETGNYVTDHNTPGKDMTVPAETYQSLVLREKKEAEKLLK